MTFAAAIVVWVCWLLPVLLLALVLRVTRQTELRWPWFAAAAIAYGLYALAGYATLPAHTSPRCRPRRAGTAGWRRSPRRAR
jgi:hypothetical protein